MERDELLGLSDAELLRLCEVQTYRGSGPGGQHRNTTDSAVRLRLTGTGVEATASERRSQHQNRAMAVGRLRLAIALQLRSDEQPVWDASTPPGKRDGRYPLYVARLLDALARADFQVGDTAKALGLSTGRLVRLLADDDEVWTVVNRERQTRGHHPLRRT